MAWEVFYYQTEAGDSPVAEFLDSLPRKPRAKCLAYMDLLEEMGLTLPGSIVAKVRGDIWELRPEWSGTEYRFLYFTFIGQRIVILHGLAKKRQKLKPKDIEIAEARMKDVLRRYKYESSSPIRRRTEKA